MKSSAKASILAKRNRARVVNPGARECKRNEEILPNREEQYRLLFEANPTPMWVWEVASLRFLAVNNAAVRQYGYSCEEFLARTLRDLCPAETLEKLERTADTAADSAETTLCRHLRKDGSAILVSVYTSPTIFGKRPARLAIATDVTEQQRADLKIRQSEANLALAQRVAHLGSWEVDVTNREDRANNPPRWSDETFRIFGLEPGAIEVTHDSFFRLLHPEERAAAKKTFVEQLRTGQPYCADHRIVRPDGSERIVHVVSDTVRNSAGRAVRLGGTVQDITEKKRAEEALQMQARVIESMAEGVVVADEAGMIVTSNPTFERMFGYAPGELVGRSVSILNALEDAASEELVVQVMETVRQNSIWVGELERRRKDGALFVTRTQVSAFFSAGRRHFFAVEEDITARKQTEETLRQTEKKFRSIFENAVEGIFQTTPEGGILAANPALARILGFASPEELMEARYDVGQQGYVDPERRATFKRLIDTQDIVNGFESELYRKDGSKVWVSENSRTVRGAGGEILYFEGTIEDITERKRAQQCIREQAELLNLAHDAIIVRDLEDRIEFWNRGAEKLYGWTAEEARGRRVIDLIYRDAQPFTAAKEELLRNGNWRGELQHVCKDGRKLIINSRWTLVRGETGEPESVLVIHTDVTEQKKLEAQFLRSQRLESIGTLAAGVAHDLNNILAPILLVSPL
nr:PAS domain S-box protein [Chthoniobacterales bacterium]